MNQSDPAGNPAKQLETRRQIDAICDRFELAWNGDSPPRIEDYLELLPPSDRRPLLAELLASELALRGSAEPEMLAHYTARFPHDRDLVEAALDHCSTESDVKPADDPHTFFEIIKGFRERRRTTASTTVIYDGDRGLRALSSQLARYQVEVPADGEISLAAQLWLSIFQARRRQRNSDADALDTLIRDLLEPFPPPRQAILIDILFGHAVDQAAQAGGVTQRTVISTVQVARQLLEEAR